MTLVRQGTSGLAICGHSASAAYDVVNMGCGVRITGALTSDRVISSGGRATVGTWKSLKKNV